jgi:hypothetical protein
MPFAFDPVPQAEPTAIHPAPAAALGILLTVFDSLRLRGGTVWDGAVPWFCLRAVGLPESAVQELLAAGLAEHALETTRAGERRRTFRQPRSARLTSRSCLVLTARGAGYARQTCAADGRTAGPAERPVWDPSTGELCWEGHLIKRFRRDAANQRLVLDALDGSHWPHSLDNPFRTLGILGAKKRLRWTIEGLNEGQTGPRQIHFRGDGRGGVCWEVT